MTTWHKYPQHRDAHPDRPWWRYDVESRAFVRTDNEVLTWNRPESMDEAVAAPHLAAYDEHCPLPPPPPLCGQVWSTPEEPAFSIVCEEGPLTVRWGYEASTWGPLVEVVEEWPPAGAVLVAGPLSPWADTSEEAP